MKTTDDNYKRYFEILAQSGQIERHKASFLPKRMQENLAFVLMGAFVGFVFGFYVAVRAAL